LGAYPGNYRGGFTLGQPGALAGQTNTATRFDGASGEMTAGSPALSAAGSVEGWFKWSSGVALMRDHSTYSAGGWILAYDSGGFVKFRVAGKTYTTTRTSASLRDGGWHHVVLTKNGGAVVLYIDGQPLYSGTGASNVAVVGPWHVMRNGAYNQFSGGLADEVALYSTALPAATVQQHYAAGR
jgi:Concanavalin A-like lectin/glucanases superfamily